MTPQRAGSIMLVVIVLLLAGALLMGCARRAAGLEAAIVQESAVDEARLRASDGSLYQPAFRILDDGRRLRLIVQDPNTHHYVLVR